MKMNLLSILAIQLVALISIAQTQPSIEVNMVSAIHNSAPGLTFTGIATGTGINDSGNVKNCTLLYKNLGNKIILTLILGNQVSEIDFANQLSSYVSTQDEEDVLDVNYDSLAQSLYYRHDFGHMTNQYTGANTYILSINKKSESTFEISYYHGWADDDGMSGDTKTTCLLSTEK